MNYGKIVAERYKKQYFRKRTGWAIYPEWRVQPEEIHAALMEVKSKRAVNAIIGNDSWTNKFKRFPRAAK